jgi:hypothetical protein
MKVEGNGFSAARIFLWKPGNSSKLGAARPKPLRQKFPIRKSIFNFERAGHGPASSPEPYAQTTNARLVLRQTQWTASFERSLMVPCVFWIFFKLSVFTASAGDLMIVGSGVTGPKKTQHRRLLHVPAN